MVWSNAPVNGSMKYSSLMLSARALRFSRSLLFCLIVFVTAVISFSIICLPFLVMTVAMSNKAPRMNEALMSKSATVPKMDVRSRFSAAILTALFSPRNPDATSRTTFSENSARFKSISPEYMLMGMRQKLKIMALYHTFKNP